MPLGFNWYTILLLLFAAIGLLIVGAVVVYRVKSWLDDRRWKSSQDKAKPASDYLNQADAIVTHEVASGNLDSDALIIKVRSQVTDLILSDYSELAGKFDFDKSAFEFKIKKHHHWEWWTDFGLRVLLTLGAAFFTWCWFLYIQSTVKDLPKSKLSDPVIIALLTTTTANILGAWAIVARYVWRVKEAKSDESSKELAPPSDTDDKTYKIKIPKEG